jgi:uncharacterized MAPEG superfamily protein
MMTFELKVMLAIAFLYWFLGHVGVPTKTRIAGLAWNMGNRETSPQFPAWTDRADRAQRNLLESLPLYFALAICLTSCGISNTYTQLGAWLFLGGRLAHAAIFIAGIPIIRTLAYAVAIAGLMLMAIPLIK